MVKIQTFSIGRTLEGKPVTLDIPQLIDSRLLVQANSGGGKSWLLRLIAERVADKVPIVILDPEGEFGTLREKLDIALVGQGGEIATDVRSAGLLARKVAEMRFSAVIDLYDLKLPDRRKYVRLFLESLMSIPRSLWHPMLVILDEAHIFAPEKSHGEAESTNAVIALMSQGRKRGIAGLLATQRLSKLNKDACETNIVFIGRTWLDTDQDRAGKILGLRGQDRQMLRDLPPGQFYGFGPALNTPGVTCINVDTVITTHPKPGERHTLEVPQSSAAIRDIVAQIGDLPKQAEEETRTLADAQRKIAELERLLRARPVQLEQKVETRIERIEVPMLGDGDARDLLEAAREASRIGDKLASISAGIRKSVDDAARIKTTPVRAIATVVPPRARMPSSAKPTTPDAVQATLRSGERKMLQVLASRYPVKYTRSQLGTLAGFTPSGGTFGNYFGTLKRLGFITENGRDVEITQAGLDYLGADIPPQPETTAELLAMWKAVLREGERKMLDQLVEIYPEAMTRQDLGERTGFTHTGGTFGNYLGSLRRNRLIEVDGDQVRASATLFA